VRPVPAGYTRRYDTIGHEFLDAESGAANVTPAMYALLDDIIDEAKQRLPAMRADLTADTYVPFATRVFTGIDCILLSRGFVYPAHGWVQLLADGLAPTVYDDPVDVQALLRQYHNRDRRAFIAARGRGPYHVVDCDVASYVYLAIADEMRYPLHLVEIPEHDFVRWEHDARTHLDFETMDGIVTDDDHYRNAWHIPDALLARGSTLASMSRTSLIAYHLGTTAVAFSFKGMYRRELDEFALALALDPASGTAANNLAWFYAAVPEREWRDGARAVRWATVAVEAARTANHLDTLACAYAQNGEFDKAAQTEREAQTAPFSYIADVAGNLARFAAREPCTDTKYRVDPNPFPTPTIARR
jgi:hypothetical protein